MILFFLSFSIQAKTLFRSTVMDFKVVEKKDEVIVRISDTIEHPLAAIFRDSLDLLNGDKTTVIELDSGGGTIAHGYEIIDIIEKLKVEGYKVVTRVLNGRKCGSMCVPIFLSADYREAGAISTFMFHGVMTGPSNVPNEKKTNKLFDYMRGRGLSESFFEFLNKEEALSKAGEYWIVAKDLQEMKSGIITKLLSNHKLYKPRKVPFYPRL